MRIRSPQLVYTLVAATALLATGASAAVRDDEQTSQKKVRTETHQIVVVQTDDSGNVFYKKLARPGGDVLWLAMPKSRAGLIDSHEGAFLFRGGIVGGPHGVMQKLEQDGPKVFHWMGADPQEKPHVLHVPDGGTLASGVIHKGTPEAVFLKKLDQDEDSPSAHDSKKQEDVTVEHKIIRLDRPEGQHGRLLLIDPQGKNHAVVAGEAIWLAKNAAHNDVQQDQDVGKIPDDVRKLLAERGIALDGADDVDVTVENEDGKMSIRIEARRGGAAAGGGPQRKFERRIELFRRDEGDSPSDLLPHPAQEDVEQEQSTKFIWKFDNDGNKTLANAVVDVVVTGSNDGPQIARVVQPDGDRTAPIRPRGAASPIEQRLQRLERQLDSLEEKIDQLLQRRDR